MPATVNYTAAGAVHLVTDFIAPLIAVSYLHIAWDTLFLFRPFAKIYQLATFATKWPERAFLTPLHHFAAGGAGDVNNIVVHSDCS
ncbi:hypothetical protein BG74_05585 [Sodalis-like endosymbiont of Proechinophthirus fluctus]|nr:hypothetical protein BG74_05585 [Sodalis-like endosymbiont of Proechinophthirus fluctus]